MSSQEIADFYPLATAVSPSQVSGFLASQHWTQVDVHEGAFERWAQPDFNPEHYPQILYLLPLNREYADFARRFAELMAALADHYGCDSAGLRQLISRHTWDSLTVRLAHVDPDADTIGLTEARETLEAIHRLLDASARYTHDPYTSFGGRPSREVTSYLRERVTLGHTQRGSFVFPVYSLLRGQDDSPQPFGRAVMENLAKGLSWLGNRPFDAELGANAGSTQKLAAKLAKVLLPLSGFPDLKSISLSLQWAPGRPEPRFGVDESTLFTPETIRTAHANASQAAGRPRSTQWVDRDDLPSTPAVPTTAYDPTERVNFSGPVLAVTLDNRLSASGSAGGFVIVGRDGLRPPSEVQVAINADDYLSAVVAHRARALVTVRGTMFQRAGTWWVDGQVSFQTDRSALPSSQTTHDDQ
ncbi:hypothetical protein [Streptomyces nojiriensis]|uniref:hypothetical protein n=1 Tax=Streptomyces nojiriensis TaxID=66374 RepID=UPI00365E29AA